jgi:hypothetical protein
LKRGWKSLAEEGFGTHYVVLAYELNLDHRPPNAFHHNRPSALRRHCDALAQTRFKSLFLD